MFAVSISEKGHISAIFDVEDDGLFQHGYILNLEHGKLLYIRAKDISEAEKIVRKEFGYLLRK